MDTMISLSPKDALFLLILIGLCVLLCYIIALTRNLTVSVKSLNKILKDTEVVSEVAARRAKDTDKMLDEASETVGSLYKTIKGNQSTIGALSAIINSLVSLKNLMSKRDKA
jgi:sensor histidine kinase YesM